MPEKRSRKGRIRHRQRFLEYRQLCRREMREVWLHAIWDHERQEVTNTYPCHWNHIENAEVLIDSRGQGFLQRL